MKLKHILCISILSIGNAFADEHLIPEESVFTNPFGYSADAYYANVLSVLRDAYAPGVFARVVVVPSFTREYAVAISRDNDAYKIVHLEPSHHIWLFEVLEMYKRDEIKSYDLDGKPVSNDDEIASLEEELPANIDGVTVDACEIAIPKQTAQLLHTVWAEMIFRTHHVDRRPVSLDGDEQITVGADGVTYHYSFDYGGKALGGQVWSPEEDSPAGRFVKLTELMRILCLESTGELSAVSTAARELLNGLETP